MGRIDKVPPWLAYVLWGMFLLAGCILYAGRHVASQLSTQIMAGAVFGFIMWVFLIPFHIVVQAAGRRLVRRALRVRPLMDLLVLGIPSVVFVTVIAFQGKAQREESVMAFASLVGEPIPSSVQIRSFGELRGIGESRLALQFTITREDLTNVTKRGGYKLKADFERDIALWTQQIERATGVVIEVRAPCRHYVAWSGNVVKDLFYNPEQEMGFLWATSR